MAPRLASSSLSLHLLLTYILIVDGIGFPETATPENNSTTLLESGTEGSHGTYDTENQTTYPRPVFGPITTVYPSEPAATSQNHQAAKLAPVTPVLYGVRLEGEATQFDRGKIVLPPDKAVRIVVFGADINLIREIIFTKGDCNGNKTDIVEKLTERDFIRHVENKIEFDYRFMERQELRVCAEFGGQYLKFADEHQLVVRSPEPDPIFVPKLFHLWIQIPVIICLHVMSAFFSGLSLGLMALTVRELEIIAKSGSEKEQKYAKAILPIRRKGNQLLCTLLLGNTLCNTTISILMDDILHAHVSIVITTATLLLFGEILPQSICVNNALATGARMVYFAKFFMIACGIITWPISKILDCFVGEEHESYDRKRLMELMNRVIENNPEVIEDELKIAAGAISLKGKVIYDSMTTMDAVFMLPETAMLNASAIAQIVRAGYTRIPVFRGGDKKDICDVLIVKDLALIDPDDNYTVRMLCNIYKHPVPKMSHDTTLLNALQIFRKGDDGHLAVVYQTDENNTVGIITLEDVVEEILQEEIKDEFDLKREKRGPQKILWDTTAPPAVMGKQLLTVTYQFCVANEEAFTEKFIEKNIFQRLMTSCTKSVDVHYLKPLGGALTVPLKQLPRCARLYTKDEPSDRYILILEGRAEVTIGQGGMKFEAGPFHRFGHELLLKLMQNAEDLCRRPYKAGFDPRPIKQFKPDYSVAVFEDCTFLEVTADMYIKALRMTNLQKATKNTAAVYTDFKPRGSPTTTTPLITGGKEENLMELTPKDRSSPVTDKTSSDSNKEVK